MTEEKSSVIKYGNELLEIIGLPWMENLEDYLPSRLKIEEVERQSDERYAEIGALTIVNIDCIRKFWVNEIWFQTYSRMD